MTYIDLESGVARRQNVINESKQRFSLGERMPSGIACNRHTHVRMHARSQRKLGSRVAKHAFRRVRDTYLPLSSTITSGWSKRTRLGISEIIISQSLAGWQICQRGVKCHLLRDRGTWIDFFYGYTCTVLHKNTILIRFEFSKADRIKLYPMAWSSGFYFGMMICRHTGFKIHV